MPLNLSSQDGNLIIVWNDGVRMEYAASVLRNSCPCATCRAKRDAPAPDPLGLPVLSIEEAAPTKFNDLAGKLGVELDDLYKLEVSQAEDGTPVTVEDLKDHY